MGCSASSPAGVGRLYIPDDEGDTRWEEDVDQRERRRSRQTKDKAAASEGVAACRCQQPEEACESLVSLACSKDAGAGSSPMRRPLDRHLQTALRNFPDDARAEASQPVPEPGWKLDNSILDTTIDSDDGDAVNQAFSNRTWLVLPEQQYDLTSPHPALPPFLGSMYWTAASEPTPKSSRRGTRKDEGEQYVPSLLTPSTMAESPMEASPPDSSSPCTRFGIQTHDVHQTSTVSGYKLSPKRKEKLILSLNSTEDWSEATSVSSSTENDGGECAKGNDHSGLMSPRESVDISRELLDYSALEESYILEPKKSLQIPRRLFEEEEGINGALSESFEAMAAPKTPERRVDIASDSGKKKGAKHKLQSLLCLAPSGAINTPGRPSSLPKPQTPSSPNVATFHGQFGSRRERHISTLPNPHSDKPLRLRVTESGLSGHRGRHPNLSGVGSGIGQSMSTSSPGDFYSYDPFMSTGKYTVALPNGKSYGNGLAMKMGGQFMILEDSRGMVLAVVKSRHTHAPSAVVYAPKPRFAGQAASGHRLTRRAKGGGTKTEAVVVDDEAKGAPLFPWALISKAGRTMEDECAVHLVKTGADGASRKGNPSSNGLFDADPTFRGRHGFDRELHTHTVVSRTTAKDAITPPSSSRKSKWNRSKSNNDNGKSASLEEAEVPCCVIVRDPTNLDAVDITVAPGIDPLLMICYMTSHSKMDVEPIFSGY